jgi:hypothetical protein
VEFLTSTDAFTWTPVATGAVFTGAAVTGLAVIDDTLVAVGWRHLASGDQAVAWARLGRGTWRPPTALDPRSIAGSDQAYGVCATANLAAVVGDLQPARGGPVPRAWLSGDGVHWTTATVAPDGRLARSDVIAGCTAASLGPALATTTTTTTPAGVTSTSSGTAGAPIFDAFGTMAVTGANPAPAYWSSSSGRSWAPQTSSPFGPAFPFPADNLARGVPAWLAVAGAPSLGPLPTGASGLWRSSDAGATWQQLDTTGLPWQGLDPAQIDRVTWFADVPVVAGQVDGRLAVWTGIPNA